MREERQKEAVEAYLSSDGRSIINACPRFGKIKVGLDILNHYDEMNPMVFTPRVDIQKGWMEDAKKFGYQGAFDFKTFASIRKLSWFSHKFVIIDEPHELSANQREKLNTMLKDTRGWDRRILGLTGTMTQKTRTELYDDLGLDVCYKYSIDQGVADGILADYEITVHLVPLNALTKSKFKRIEWVRDNECDNPLQKKFLNLKLINIIQNSMDKLAKTKELIGQFSNERVLVFCGVSLIADSLEIPVYHSKKRDKDTFNNFCEGIGDSLATIKMMQAGITITPINRGIINYMSGNPEDSAQKICRFLGFEYGNPGKKASIHIVATDEKFELDRIKTALLFFDNKKVNFE